MDAKENNVELAQVMYLLYSLSFSRSSLNSSHCSPSPSLRKCQFLAYSFVVSDVLASVA